jgi:hypothetical protein
MKKIQLFIRQYCENINKKDYLWGQFFVNNIIINYTYEQFCKSKDDEFPLGNLRHALLCNDGELYGPSGFIFDLEGFYRS